MMTKEIYVIECNTKKGGLEFLLKSQINQISDFFQLWVQPNNREKERNKGTHTHTYINKERERERETERDLSFRDKMKEVE